MRVVYTVDDGFAMPLATSLRSLADHTSGLDDVEITVLTPRFSAEALDRVRRSCPELAVEVVAVPESALAGLPSIEHWGLTPFLRLMLLSLVADDEPFLLLDADTVVLDDIRKLHATPLAGKPLAAVQDPIMQTFGAKPDARRFAELGVDPATPYFNAGAVVIDPVVCRERDVMGRAMEYVRRYRDELENPDEEAVNVVLAGDWVRLEPQWNVIAIVAGAIVVARKLGRDYPLPEGYRDAVRNPRIVHYAGKDKPWHADAVRSAFAGLFYDHLDKTAWRGWRPQGSEA